MKQLKCIPFDLNMLSICQRWNAKSLVMCMRMKYTCVCVFVCVFETWMMGKRYTIPNIECLLLNTIDWLLLNVGPGMKLTVYWIARRFWRRSSFDPNAVNHRWRHQFQNIPGPCCFVALFVLRRHRNTNKVYIKSVYKTAARHNNAVFSSCSNCCVLTCLCMCIVSGVLTGSSNTCSKKCIIFGKPKY